MSSRTSNPNLRLMLPPDLALRLERHAAVAPRGDTRGAWAHYEQAKRLISKAVGWDSPDPSSRMYELGVLFYCERAGL